MTDEEEYYEPALMDWWNEGRGRNEQTILTTKAGAMRVYVRRNIVDPMVMEIASVSTLWGFGSARLLYGSLTRDIPAFAENILNPDLDAYLAKTGWNHAYRDQADTPTRVNQAFQKRYPAFREAHTAFAAILAVRGAVMAKIPH